MSEHELGVCSYFMLTVTLSCSSGFEIRKELPLVSLECFYLFLLLFVFGVGQGGWEGGWEGGWSVSPQGVPRKETVAERTFVPRHKGGTLVPRVLTDSPNGEVMSACYQSAIASSTPLLCTRP